MHFEAESQKLGLCVEQKLKLVNATWFRRLSYSTEYQQKPAVGPEINYLKAMRSCDSYVGTSSTAAKAPFSVKVDLTPVCVLGVQSDQMVLLFSFLLYRLLLKFSCAIASDCLLVIQE